MNVTDAIAGALRTFCYDCREYSPSLDVCWRGGCAARRSAQDTIEYFSGMLQTELDKLRAEVERMRPVVEAARRYIAAKTCTVGLDYEEMTDQEQQETMQAWMDLVKAVEANS